MAERGLVPDDRGRGLSRHQFEEVIRRAAELAAREPDAGSRLSEAELFRIAGEVGLPEEHVRLALAEVRSPPLPRSGLPALVAGPWVRVSRVVPGTRAELAATIDRFLVGGRLLQPVRKGTDQMVYWPAKDWASQIARAASATGKRYYIASAKRVEVFLEPVRDDAVAVEFAVDPGLHSENLAGAILGGLGGGGGAGVGVAFAVATAAPLALGVAAGVAVGALVAGGIAHAVGVSYHSQLERVRLEVEGVLDALERREPLEPPPPSWRRWVSRHFGGIAKDLGFEEESER
ncbi:MAG: hypothetical protein R3E98_17130 [Gemmatimonadota bacterium]